MTCAICLRPSIFTMSVSPPHGHGREFCLACFCMVSKAMPDEKDVAETFVALNELASPDVLKVDLTDPLRG